ncbi:MAG: ADP-ribosylglycohydrolase family protein [Peptostreptococcaceae bacterium]|nr:ADP-ribosylglycohydrolase family protein [Peptostreptococcaceae bacterium]
MNNKVRSGILGHAIGDSIGVPFEFESREKLKTNPVMDMVGWGTYNQPEGTWSDDTTMTLCLIESLKNGLEYSNIMDKFSDWLNNGAYTPYNETFDVGNGTQRAITRYLNGVNPLDCGGSTENDNGNGALMRILPMAFYLVNNKPIEISEEVTRVASLTHNHVRSHIACTIYVFIAIALLKGLKLGEAIDKGLKEAFEVYKGNKELIKYERIAVAGFKNTEEWKIDSSGYVVSTLEAAIWCLLNTDCYKDAILKAVNLGNDTDTVAAITGGLAGIYYGIESIPKEWIAKLARKDYIINLCDEFAEEIK